MSIIGLFRSFLSGISGTGAVNFLCHRRHVASPLWFLNDDRFLNGQPFVIDGRIRLRILDWSWFVYEFVARLLHSKYRSKCLQLLFYRVRILSGFSQIRKSDL